MLHGWISTYVFQFTVFKVRRDHLGPLHSFARKQDKKLYPRISEINPLCVCILWYICIQNSGLIKGFIWDLIIRESCLRALLSSPLTHMCLTSRVDLSTFRYYVFFTLTFSAWQNIKYSRKSVTNISICWPLSLYVNLFLDKVRKLILNLIRRHISKVLTDSYSFFLNIITSLLHVLLELRIFTNYSSDGLHWDHI